MDEDFIDSNLISKFEKMMENEDFVFFDSDELVDIMAYYLDSFDFEYASKALQFALKQYPENLDLKIKELEYLVGVNDLQKASVLIQELEPSCSDDLDYLLSVAKYWSLRKLTHTAIHYYKKALDLDEEKDYILNCIGTEYMDNKQYLKAIQYFKQNMKYTKATDDFALASLVHCYEALKRDRACIAYLSSLTDINPYSEEIWYQLGFQHMSINDYNSAVEAFDYVLAINPKSIAGYMQKAYCFEKQEAFYKAINVYEESLQYDDTRAFTYMKMGQVYMKLKRFDVAITYLVKAVEGDSQLDKAWAELSDVYDAIGEMDKAIYAIGKALSLEDDEVNYWKRYAYLSLKHHNYSSALESFKAIVNLEPTLYLNWLAYAELLINAQEYEEAIVVLNQGLNKIKPVAEIYYQMSNCYFMLDNEEEGKRNLSLALALNSDIKNDMGERYPAIQKPIELMTNTGNIE